VAKDQACKLQILSAKHPDLLVTVHGMFRRFATLEKVRELIEGRYHEIIAETAIAFYKKKYWNTHLRMVRERKASILGVAEIIGEDGLTAGVNALLWESLEDMSVPQLTTFKKALNDADKVKLMKKQLAVYMKEHRQKMKEREAASAKADESEISDPVEDYEKAQRVVAQVKEIFGIGMTGAQPPRPPLLRAGKQEPPPDIPTVRREPVSA
jgi:hypothetical protein